MTACGPVKKLLAAEAESVEEEGPDVLSFKDSSQNQAEVNVPSS